MKNNLVFQHGFVCFYGKITDYEGKAKRGNKHEVQSDKKNGQGNGY